MNANGRGNYPEDYQRNLDDYINPTMQTSMRNIWTAITLYYQASNHVWNQP